MPKLPTNMEKAHAAAEKSRKRLGRRKKDEAKTAAALEELAQRMAQEMGASPGEKITVFMCRRGRR